LQTSQVGLVVAINTIDGGSACHLRRIVLRSRARRTALTWPAVGNRQDHQRDHRAHHQER